MTSSLRRTALLQLSIAACAAFAGTLAWGQSFPSKPLKIIVPTSAGGGNDFIARTIAKKLEDSLGWTVVVDNKPGASGIIAAEYVAKSAPDGYTILFNGPLQIQVSALYKKLPYDPIKDFTPLTDIILTPLWFAVNPNKVAAKSVKEFTELARDKTRKDSYGSPGQGSSHHMYAFALNDAAKLNMIHVPYKGGAPATVALVGGEVSSIFIDFVSLRPFVADGRVRLLAVTGPRRSPLTPDVPTLSELGFPGFESLGWGGLFLPSKTPSDVVERLYTEVHKALQQPDVVEKFKAMGFQMGGSTPQQFASTVAADQVNWGKLIKQAGVTLD